MNQTLAQNESPANATELARAPQLPLRRPQHLLREAEDGAAELHLALPGVAKSAIGIRVRGQALEIEARREAEAARGGCVYRFAARLHPRLDPEAVAARLEDGVLLLRIPLKPSAQAREVRVD